MDLAKFDTVKASETGAFMHLEWDGKKLYTEEEPKEAVGLWLRGPDSKAARAAERKLSDDKTRRVKVGRGNRVKDFMGAEESAERETEVAAAYVIRFQNIVVDGVSWDGQEATKTVELFQRFPWIQRQVEEFTSDEANILGG